ncbi:MAG: chaperonin GroEL, partial [Planctomycetota bacterium]
MSVKLIHFSQRARSDIEDGVRKLAAAVKATLGPQGKVVALQKKFGPPMITKDGVTIAKEIELEDRFENAATQMVREVAVKTSEAGGDGTTLATILAEAIFLGALHNVEAGADPIALERGVRRAVEAVTKALKKGAKRIGGTKDIERVATVASNNDPEIGRIIAEAIDRVGKDGAVTVEEGRTLETTVDLIEGMQFDRGFLSPHFINRVAKMQCELQDPYVLIHEKKLESVKELVPLLEQAARAGKPLLIIAEDVGAEVLAMLVVNRMRGVMNSCAVKAPAFGDRRKEMLEDIAILTGGRPVLADFGIDLESVKLSDLGRALRVVVEKENTTIIQGAGKKADVDGRVALIKKQ